METIHTKPMDYLEVARLSYSPSIYSVLIFLQAFLVENGAKEIGIWSTLRCRAHRQGSTVKKLETDIFLLTDYLQRVCKPMMDGMPMTPEIQSDLEPLYAVWDELDGLKRVVEKMKAYTETNEGFTSIVEQLEKMMNLCKYAQLQMVMYHLNRDIEKADEEVMKKENEMRELKTRKSVELSDKQCEFLEFASNQDEMRKRYKEDA